MYTAATHRTESELLAGLEDIRQSPADNGRLEAIFVRPREDERRALNTVEVTPEDGMLGDRWAHDHWQHLPDGSPDPRSQIALMNVRILRQLAGEEAAWALAGDNLIVDLDLSEANLPVGTRLQIGGAMLEITDVAHTGCHKFARRYGKVARAFVNGPHGKPLNLRGIYGQVVVAGTIRVGDAICKV